MKRNLLLLIIAVVFSLGVATQAMAAEKVYKLRYSDENAEAGIAVQVSTVPFLKMVSEATGGRVVFDSYFGSTLNAPRDIWDNLTKGIADMGFVSLPHQPGRIPLMDVFGLPGLPYKTGAERAAAMWQLYEKYPEIQNEFTRGGVRPLILFSVESQPLIMSKKPVYNLEDLKNLKIRTLGGPATTQMKLLGGVPIPLPMSEVYLSLDKGVIDGIACSVTAVATWRFYEIVKYIVDAPLTASYLGMLMSEKKWQSLPADIQEQMMSVGGLQGSVWYATKWCDDFVAQVPDIAAANRKTLEYITLSPEEWDRWVEVSMPAVEEWIKANEAKGLGDISRQIYEDLMNKNL